MSYSNLLSCVQKYENSDTSIMNLNFNNSLFWIHGKFRFPYSVKSALLIIKNATEFFNSRDLLVSHYFKDALNLHSSSETLKEENSDYEDFGFKWWDEEFFENSEYTKSQLSQEEYFLTLEISNWSYETLVLSATFFYIEHIHSKWITEKLLLTTSGDFSEFDSKFFDKSFSELEIAATHIALLILSKPFGKKLFFTLKKTNIFLVYP